MSKYSSKVNARSYWIFPKPGDGDNGEISKAGVYSHDDLLEELDGKLDFEWDGCEENHGQAFDLGFLRVTVVTDYSGELNLQWASLLTAFQRKRATELLSDCARVEISGAEEGMDPEGNWANARLEVADSTFRRKFAAGLRQDHGEWNDEGAW